jgi:hypothetical protein
MNIGIDWVSAGIFVAAYVFSQIKAVPASLRYGVLAAACLVIAGYRFRTAGVGINLALTGLAALLAVYYAYKAFQSRRR